MLISQAAFDLIVQEETGGKALYDAKECHTDWPGGASGVTVGTGYDCGYQTQIQIANDWNGIIPGEMIARLQSVAGVRGSPARALAHELQGLVTISWEQALAVFTKVDVPQWTMRVQASLPNTDKISGDSLGSIVSLAFNRGCSFALFGDRYTEMRNIKAHMQAEEFAKIPAEFRSMKRLWPHSSDLRNRREHEAALFEKGLS